MSHTLCPVSPNGDLYKTIAQNHYQDTDIAAIHQLRLPQCYLCSWVCSCVCAHALFGSSFYLHVSAEIFHLSQEGSPLILRRLRYIL